MRGINSKLYGSYPPARKCAHDLAKGDACDATLREPALGNLTASPSSRNGEIVACERAEDTLGNLGASAGAGKGMNKLVRRSRWDEEEGREIESRFEQEDILDWEMLIGYSGEIESIQGACCKL